MHTCGVGMLGSQNELGKNINGSPTTSFWDSSPITLNSAIHCTATLKERTKDRGRCTFVISTLLVRSEKFQEAIRGRTRGGRPGRHITGNLKIEIIRGSVPPTTCPRSDP